MTKYKYTVTKWEERDRLHINLSGPCVDLDWRDDLARQMFEDGFFNASNLEESVIAYAKERGLIPKVFRVLSIDAWRNAVDGGWDWNNWFEVGYMDETTLNRICSRNGWQANARKLFNWFRAKGYLSERSKGRVSFEDDGYNITVCERSNGRPLFAVEYGSED